MGEKRYQPVMDGAFQHGESGSYVVDTLSEKRNWSDPPGYEMTAGEVCDLLNAQSAEIAGMRDLLKGVIEFADSGDFDGAISLALYRRIQSAIGVELPNPSEIPNSSEVSDAAEGG